MNYAGRDTVDQTNIQQGDEEFKFDPTFAILIKKKKVDTSKFQRRLNFIRPSNV